MRTCALGLRAAALALAVSPLFGCGGVYYAITVGAAQSRLEEARQLGAEQYSTYEYYYAKAHLEQAAVEAGEASYSDAADFAEVAEQYAIKAIEHTKAVKGDAPAEDEKAKEEAGERAAAGKSKEEAKPPPKKVEEEAEKPKKVEPPPPSDDDKPRPKRRRKSTDKDK